MGNPGITQEAGYIFIEKNPQILVSGPAQFKPMVQEPIVLFVEFQLHIRQLHLSFPSHPQKS